MISKKKYWVVSQLFYPDETSTGFVMTKIAEKVATLGEVNVICGSSNYQSDFLNNATHIDKNIIIHRINTIKWNKDFLISRLFGFIILSIKIAVKILLNIKKEDTVLIVTNPPIVILFVSLIKKIRKFKLIVALHDVFPENLVAAGVINPTIGYYKIILKLFNFSYNSADHLIACGEDMKQIFHQKVRKTLPISVITNWADHEEIFAKNIDRNSYLNYNLDDKVVIEFAGNIGRVQGLDQFLEIFLKVKNPNLFLIIIGDGAFKRKLIILQKLYNSNAILFLNSKPRSEQNNFLNACDIGLVTLNKGMFGLGVPSKVYNIFSAGKPVLYIGDHKSEIYNYIKEYNTGWAFNWNEEEEIECFLANINKNSVIEFNLKGVNARALVEKRFLKEQILNQYLNVL